MQWVVGERTFSALLVYWDTRFLVMPQIRNTVLAREMRSVALASTLAAASVVLSSSLVLRDRVVYAANVFSVQFLLTCPPPHLSSSLSLVLLLLLEHVGRQLPPLGRLQPSSLAV